jgi:DNA (cytosine-5)-methyltransferase 1
MEEQPMTRPTMLDTYCKAGGSAMGWDLAGFDVVGVDIEPQPNYPFEFHQCDAIEYIDTHGHEFDAVTGSPPCPRYAAVTKWRGNPGDHPDLIAPTRDAMNRAGRPWVIENVPEAPIRRDFLLCGTQFGLNIRRHRVFEVGLWTPAFELQPGCLCYRNPRLVPFEHKDERAFADALGCPWMTAKEGRDAIPPAFTEYIGRQLLAALVMAA